MRRIKYGLKAIRKTDERSAVLSLVLESACEHIPLFLKAHPLSGEHPLLQPREAPYEAWMVRATVRSCLRRGARSGYPALSRCIPPHRAQTNTTHAPPARKTWQKRRALLPAGGNSRIARSSVQIRDPSARAFRSKPLLEAVPCPACHPLRACPATSVITTQSI